MADELELQAAVNRQKFEESLAPAVQGICQSLTSGLDRVIEKFAGDLASSVAKTLQGGTSTNTSNYSSSGPSPMLPSESPSRASFGGGGQRQASHILGMLDPITQPYVIPSDPSKYVTPEAHREQFARTSENIRRLSQAKSAGIDISQYAKASMPELKERRDMLRGAMGEALDPAKIEERRKEETGLMEEIKNLTAEIRKNTEAKKDTTELREDLKSKNTALETSMAKSNVQGIGQNLNETESVMRTQTERNMKIAGGVAGVVSMAANLPSQLRAGEIGSADVGNLSARAGMSGDIMRQIAIQKAGGEGAIQSQAGLEAVGGIAGNLGLGIAAGTASYFTGGPTNPIGAGFGAAALGQGAQVVTGLANFGARQSEKAESIIGREMGVNKEQYDIMQSGMGLDIKGYSMARSLGAPGMASWMGGSESSIRHAGNVGLGQDERQALQAQVAQGGAGAFGTEAAWATKTDREMEGLMTSKAQGFSGAGAVAGAMIRGGERTESGMKKAMTETKDLWIEMIASGMDRSTASRFLERMAADAGKLGAAGAAKTEAQISMELSKGIFGTTTGAAGEFAQDFTSTMRKQTQSGSTMMQAAGLQAGEQTRGDFSKAGISMGRGGVESGGLGTGLGDQLARQSWGLSREELNTKKIDDQLRRRFEKEDKEGKGEMGPQLPMEQRLTEEKDRLFKKSQVNTIQSAMRMAERSAGGDKDLGAYVMARQMGGNQSTYQSIKKIQSLESEIFKEKSPEKKRKLQEELDSTGAAMKKDLVKGLGERGGAEYGTAMQIEASKAASGLQTFSTRAEGAASALEAVTKRINEILFQMSPEGKAKKEAEEKPKIQYRAGAHGTGMRR